MQRKIRDLFMIFLLSFIFINTAFAADFSNLVILHTDDSHGYDAYDEEKGYMGMAAIAQKKKDLESQGKKVLLLDAGDFSQGSTGADFSKGEAVIEYMRVAGYDAAAIGNHEFSYGLDQLLRNKDLAETSDTTKAKGSPFQMVSCNIIKDNNHLFTPSVILDKDGYKIGIIGVTTPETMISATPSYVAGLDFAAEKQMYSIVQQEVDKMQGQVDLIIALAHLGNEKELMGSRSTDLAQNVSGLDIIIDGHDHERYTTNINGTLLAEAGPYTKFLGMTSYENGKWVESFIPFADGMTQDETVKKLVDEELARINAELGVVIGKTNFKLSDKKAGSTETNIGNLVADAFVWKAKQILKDTLNIDDTLSIQNAGGLRASLEQGDITRRNVSDVLTFRNELYCVKVTGKTILEILEASCQAAPDGFNGFPQVGNAEYTVNTKVPYAKGDLYDRSTYNAPAAPGARVTIKSIGGKPFDINKVYNLITNSFIVEGGDSYGALAKSGAIIEKIPLSCIDTDALMEFIENALGGVIPDKYALPQGRTKVGRFPIALPNSKSLNETRATGMALLNNGADLVIGKGFMSAQAAAEADNNTTNNVGKNKNNKTARTNNSFTPYAATGAYNMRYMTGSYVDSKGWGINVGFARILHYQNSKLTLAPFVEYGKAGYDSYLDNGTHGSGDNSFTGIGFMAKNEQKDGLYYEGSTRVGRMKSDYQGDVLLGRYDSASNYIALHAGIGKVVKVSKNSSIDYYGKFFWTHQNGDTVMVNRNVIGDRYRYDFEAINSYRLRLGTRWTQKFSKRDAFFVGLAWDCEFDSEARAHYEGGSTPAPSMKGSSGMLELGWKQAATKDNPLGAEVGLTGWCGKQRGVSFNAGFSWAF